MRVMLATICLNEMEHLPKLVEQHRNWPGLVGWIFVEGADPVYQRTNPELTSNGLSTDGTTEFLKYRYSSKEFPQLWHIEAPDVPPNGDQGKCHLRNKYLMAADEIEPDVIVQLDADEFYTLQDQQRINDIVEDTIANGWTAWMFKQRHIWRPSSMSGGPVRISTGLSSSFVMWNSPPAPLFLQEVVGGYWQVPHTRVWKYVPGMRHIRNHNWPEVSGQYLTANMLRCDLANQDHMPQCVHLGYASSPRSRKAKHDYYIARGEGSEAGRIGRRRRMYLDCRSAWENYRPGDVLPHGAEAIRYDGPVPEVFKGA